MTDRERAVPRPAYRAAYVTAALVILGSALGVGALELYVRAFPPTPAIQVVRSQSARVGSRQAHGAGTLRVVRGVPVWRTPERQNRDCVTAHPERQRILFFGDSITYGTGVSDSQVFPALLQGRLNALRPTPGFCVLNFAQPGFGFDQSYVIAEEEIPRLHPVLVFWQFWDPLRAYTMLGDSAYALTSYVVRGDGFPSLWLARALPEAANRWLFLHSRLYEYFTLAYGERDRSVDFPRELARFGAQKVRKVPPLAQSANAQAVFYLGTPLDKPFADSATDPNEIPWRDAIFSVARSAGIEAFRLQDVLRGQDYLALRLDTCCHFNAAGHQALARIFEAVVLRHLAEPH